MTITGKISAANYVEANFSSKTKGQKKSSLSGRYMYISAKVKKGRDFFIHVDLMMQDCNKITLTISNTFKELKRVSNRIRLPLTDFEEKWSVIVIDIYDICKKANAFPRVNLSNTRPVVEYTSFKICSYICIKGIYIGNNFFDHLSLPSIVGFLIKEKKNWRKKYGFITLPANLRELQLTDIDEDDIVKQLNVEREVLADVTKTRKLENADFEEDQKPNNTRKTKIDILREKFNNGQKSRYDYLKELTDNSLKPTTLKHIIGFTSRDCPDVRFVRSKDKDFLISSAGKFLIASSVV